MLALRELVMADKVSFSALWAERVNNHQIPEQSFQEMNQMTITNVWILFYASLPPVLI